MVNGQGEQLPAVEGTGYGEMEEQNQRLESDQNIPDPSMKGRVGRLLWHGGSVYDAWFSAASNQVAQVLLTLPTSFAQLGYGSGIAFQLFYGVMGCWACYMITWLYMEYRTRKEREGQTFKNHVIQVMNHKFRIMSLPPQSNPADLANSIRS
jgi:auxin influx carrier (AUX1 LAX family)